MCYEISQNIRCRFRPLLKEPTAQIPIPTCICTPFSRISVPLPSLRYPLCCVGPQRPIRGGVYFHIQQGSLIFSSNKCSLCYSGIMQHSSCERIFEIGPVMFGFIRYKHTNHSSLLYYSIDRDIKIMGGLNTQNNPQLRHCTQCTVCDCYQATFTQESVCICVD